MQKITPFLWFDDNAEEAVSFYTSIFKDSAIETVTRYGEAGGKASGMSKGTVMTIAFKLEGQDFIALNGGPVFTFNPAISLFVECRTQQEIDALWEKLSAGGEAGRCGWLKDKYGVSWQIGPPDLGKMLNDPDPVKSEEVMRAILKMDKIDIAGLKQAHEQR